MDREPNQINGDHREHGEGTGRERSVVLDTTDPIAEIPDPIVSTPCELARLPRVARQLPGAEDDHGHEQKNDELAGAHAKHNDQDSAGAGAGAGA